MPAMSYKPTLVSVTVATLLASYLSADQLEAVDHRLAKYLTPAVVIVASLAYLYLIVSDKKEEKVVRRRERLPIPPEGFSKEEEEFVKAMSKKATSKSELAKRLKSGKVRPNANDYFVGPDGNKTTLFSLLMYASQYSNLEAVKLLLERGADPTWKNNRGTTVMSLFQKRHLKSEFSNQLEMARFSLHEVPLEDRENFLSEKIKVGYPPKPSNRTMLDWLEEEQVDISDPTNVATDPLAFGEKEESLQRLIASNEKISEKDMKGVNVNARKVLKDKSNKGNTTYSLLMSSSYFRNFDAFKLLLQGGANPLWRNNRGATVLQLCAKRGQLDMAKECKKYVEEKEWSAFINQENTTGWTCLHSSTQNNREAFTCWLLANGADPAKAMYGSGWTSAFSCAKGGNLNIDKLLRAKGADYKVFARHRLLGKKITPSNINDFKKDELKEKANWADEIKRYKKEKAGKKGSKALVAIVVFQHFRDETLTRLGSDVDEQLSQVFEGKVDCETITFKAAVKDKESYRQFVRQIQDRMRSNEFGMLFIIISSHGGEDLNGQYFMDFRSKRIYVRRDLTDCFSVDKCAEMEGKRAVFFVNACRTRSSSEGNDVDRLEEETPIAREAKHLTVRVCTTESVSIRHSAIGSIALACFGQVLARYGASISVQRLFERTQREFLDTFWVTPKDGEVYLQMLDVADCCGEQIFFRDK